MRAGAFSSLCGRLPVATRWRTHRRARFEIRAALQSGSWALSLSDKAAESAESASPFADPDPRQASLLRPVDAPTEYESSNSFQR
jgi:hypothetical protein